MKVRFYCDVFPGSYPAHPLHATTRPHGERWGNSTRLAFDAVIPDDVLNGVDVVSPEPAVMTVVERPVRATGSDA